jgi:hypothetical protein
MRDPSKRYMYLTMREIYTKLHLSEVSVGVYPNLIGRFYFDQKRRELLVFVRIRGRLLRSVGHNSRLSLSKNPQEV